MLWTEGLYPFPNSYVEALIPKVMVLGCKAFGRWLGLDKAMRVEPPWWQQRPYKEMKGPELSLFPMWGHNKKSTIPEPGGGLSPRTHHAGTQPLQLWEINVCCFQPPCLWCSVIAATAPTPPQTLTGTGPVWFYLGLCIFYSLLGEPFPSFFTRLSQVLPPPPSHTFPYILLFLKWGCI